MSAKACTLVVGIGNPARQDDGLGTAIAGDIESWNLEGVSVEIDYQLSIEHGEQLSRHNHVLFVDADLTAGADADAPFSVRRVVPSPVVTFTSHVIGPESVLAICEGTFGSTPDAWLIGVRGYEFDIGERLTERAQENKRRALEYIEVLLRKWKGDTMAEATGKMILIIDDDPDIRASTRIVLESAGFSVGEAADGEEGLKIAQRIKPDAILLDLMMETVDAGSKVSTQMMETGYAGPVYLLSAAGDAVRYNIDAKELGLSGIFQKPIDHKVLLTTLKTKLKIK